MLQPLSERNDDADPHRHLSDADPHRHHPWCYVLYNAVSGTTADLVDLIIHGHPGSVGIVQGQGTATARGLLTVAVMSPDATRRHEHSDPYLQYAAMGKGRAVEELEYLRPNNALRWGNNGTFSFEGKLWWDDLAQGMLTCNPSVRDKVIHYVDLSSCILLHKPNKRLTPAQEASLR
ncbi:hypothetical protein ACP70R_046198 [Stipagrostis hirtigluma subsp. patula]